jgi:hypothetical protein
MDQEHMITIEDTDAAIKRCEQHLQRAATDEGSPKAKVLATEVEISGQDTAAELAALKATAKAQDAKIKALSAQLRDKKKADMAKRQSSSKDSTCHASLHGCVFDQQFVPHTPGTVLDSGAQVNILEGTLGSGTRIQLTGITGATIEAERADAVFPVIAADGSRHVISIRGKNIVATRTTDNILSLAVLLKAGYKVSFRVGTDLDPTDGGDLYTPKGKRIALAFAGNLWRLPMWSSPSRCESTAGIPAHQNPFAALVNVPDNVACTRAASQPVEVSPLELSVADQIRLCHDRDGHPSYNTHLRMYKARQGRGYPANFPSLLAHFKCETCAVTLGARTYRTSKRVKEKGYHTKRQQEQESEVIPDISRHAICLARASEPKKKRRKSKKIKKAKEPVIAAPALDAAPLLAAGVAPRLVHPPQHRMHIDYAHSITLGRNKEQYYLMIVIDSIDFTWAQSSPNRSEPENLIHDFITLTGIKVGHVRADGAGEFARSSTFKEYCTRHNIVIEEVPAYTHTFNARVEGAIRICKDKVRAFLRRANMPRRFWPDALLHWCRTYAHWPDASGHTAWEKLDELGPHSLCHDLKRDRHVFGSYVTGHLPREHPHVADTTHDDRAEEGVFLGNDLTTPTFWLWSFKHKKAMRMSDPKHFDHILPFLQPADVHHAIPLTAQEVLRMHAKDDVPVAAGASELQPDRISRSGEQSLPAAASSSLKPSRVTRSATTASQAASPLSFPDSGESVQVRGKESVQNEAIYLSPQEHKRFKHGREVPPAAQLQYLKPQLLAQALVHHKFVFTLPKRVRNDPEDLQVMVTKANSIKGFWYVECDIISPKHLRESALIQLPVVRGNTPSTDHKDNVRDLFNNIFNSPVTLADIGISEQRKELAMQAIAQVWTTGICSLSVTQTPEVIKLRQQGEEQQALERARERVERAVKDLKNKIASENEEVRQIYKQITPTFDPEDDGIWSEIDLLEGDPVHRGVAMRNPRLKPFWLKAEGGEWQGLWEKGVFKKWKRSDLLPNDRVFTSRYVYKIKRSAKTGEAYRFKARMIVRGFEMEKGVDYVDNFSPTPGLAVARLMMSLAVANDMELHKIDIEQAFLQADKLDEGVNGRYFINPPPGSPEAGNKNIVYEVLRPLYGSPSSPRALHKTMDAYFKSEGFDTIGFEESVWVRPAGGKYSEDIYVSAHVDDCLLSCKSLTVMAKFKAHMLERFIGTDEGEVTEYLGCELVRDRKARTGQLIQAGYAERVLRVFNMWDCNPVATPMDPNVRLSKLDCPEVVDPLLHRKYRSIVGCLSYLVNMTRPDLAFSFSQLSKFLQYPGEAHLAAAYRVLAYVKGTLHQGLSWHDPGAGSRNKLSGWVDSDFASDIDTRKSMTGYLMVLNGGPISWKASRQGGVTLSSSEAEFVAASQAGQEVLYLRALLKGFAYLQHGPTEIWEDNASCILMSENPTNRERSRHVDVRVHFLRDMVRDGSVKLIKCAGTQNVADALTKSLPRPAFHKHREFLKGTAQSFSAFFASADKPAVPTYVTKRGSLSFSKAPPMCIGG